MYFGFNIDGQKLQNNPVNQTRFSGITSLSPPVNNSFVITIKTDNSGTSSSNQFKIPLSGGLTYSANIDWGDGNTTTQTTDVSPTHTYASPGTYQISISGTFPSIQFANGGDKLKLLSIDNWGNITWTLLVAAFYGCTNMIGTYSDIPNILLLIVLHLIVRWLVGM